MRNRQRQPHVFEVDPLESGLRPQCPTCKGKGKIGPFWTSLESADAIDRMTEREKDSLRMGCPTCKGTGHAG